MERDIVITGIGIVSAIGTDCRSVLSSLHQGTSGIGTMRHLPSAHAGELPVGEVPLSNADMKRCLGIDVETEVSRTALMGMMAVSQALSDGSVNREGRRQIVLISGTTVGGMDLTEQHFPTFEQENGQISCLLQHDAGSSTRMIASHFGSLFCDYTTISTACSSAANAILVGAEMLVSGQADMVIAGGTEALTRFHLNGFNSLMILDHKQCRPFDETRAGLNLGEGAAYIVLETEEAARRRNAEIKARLTGWGNACDAYHQTASSPNGEGAYMAMMQALQKAALKPADIDYVNAHGTGTPNNDLTESIALRRLFGGEMPPVSSTKQLTGHTCSASGSIETVICLLAMQNGFIPANAGWENPMSDGIVPTRGEKNCMLQHVMCNSFGFGGNDTALIVSSPLINDPTAKQPTVQTKIVEAARVEITDADSLDSVRQYVKPMESRRMGNIMKAAILVSMKALKEAGIDVPDAIITATPLGCLENSELLLRQLRDEGENMFSPTHFMQSTHNTIGSAIAIRTGCHGYNITYTQGDDSLRWALTDARRKIESGECRNVLVGLYEETTPLYRTLMQRLDKSTNGPLHALAIVLKAADK